MNRLDTRPFSTEEFDQGIGRITRFDTTAIVGAQWIRQPLEAQCVVRDGELINFVGVMIENPHEKVAGMGVDINVVRHGEHVM